jgi:hypothetical protein
VYTQVFFEVIVSGIISLISFLACPLLAYSMLKLFQEWDGGVIKENDGGVNSTMIYSKNFGKCHNVPPVQQ